MGDDCEETVFLVGQDENNKEQGGGLHQQQQHQLQRLYPKLAALVSCVFILIACGLFARLATESNTKNDCSNESTGSTNSTNSSTFVPWHQYRSTMIIHYHKTGNSYSNKLIQQIKKRTQKEVHSMPMNIKFHRLEETKRTHNPSGCPYPISRPLQNSTTTSNSQINTCGRGCACTCTGMDRHINIYKITAPDLFCNDDDLRSYLGIDGDDDIYTRTAEDKHSHYDHYNNNNTNNRNGNTHNNRSMNIIHLVRDPIEMVLSSYLYHSQEPTPEPWVHDHDPCRVDKELLDLLIPMHNNNTSGTGTGTHILIRREDLENVIQLCERLMHRRDHDAAADTGTGGSGGNISGVGARVAHNKTRTISSKRRQSYYKLLRTLPPTDGVRLAAAQFLIAKGQRSAGGDLLRMTNNIMRLGAAGTRDGDNRTITDLRILTIPMGQLIEDMKGTTLKIVDLILGDKSDVCEDAHASNAGVHANADANEIHGGMIEDKRTRIELAKIIANDMDKMYKQATHSHFENHVTQGSMDHVQRQEIKGMLELDPVLGPVLLQIRSIVLND